VYRVARFGQPGKVCCCCSYYRYVVIERLVWSGGEVTDEMIMVLRFSFTKKKLWYAGIIIVSGLVGML
jgi:hypothetical protein